MQLSSFLETIMKRQYNLHEWITRIYVVIIFGIYILYTKLSYFTIIYDKYNFYMLISFVYIPLELFALSYKWLIGVGTKKTKTRKQLSLLLPLAAMIVIILLSSCLSPFQDIVWNGISDRKNGTVLYVTMIICGMLVASSFRYKRVYIDILMSVSVIMAVWTMTDFMDMDIFRMHVNIADGFKRMYVASLGQVTVFAGFFCMIFPMAVLCYLSEGTRKRGFYHIVIISGFFTVYTAHSDNLVLVLGILFLFLPALMFETVLGIKKYLFLLMEFLVIGRIMGILDTFSDSEMNYLDGWGDMIAHEWLGVVAIIAVAAALLYVHKLEKGNVEFRWKNCRKIMMRTAFSIMAFLLLLMVFFTTVGKDINIGYTLASYFRFNDLWGTDRGFVWRRIVEAYSRLPVSYKLLGTGSDTTGAVLDTILGSRAYTSAGQRYDNAHNEFLQYMLNYGILGVISYISFLVMLLKKLFSGKKECVIIAAGISGYVIQSFVSLNQVFTTPVFILLCAAGVSLLNHELNNK